MPESTPPHASRRAALKRRLIHDLWQAICAYRKQTLGAAALMVAAKLAGVSVPLILRQLVDDVAHPASYALIPVFLALAYASLRFLGDAMGEARDVVFSIVTQRTVAAFTARTFAHLHGMGARFHAQRETGSVVRDVQKGADGIGYLLGTALFTILPALVEITAVIVILVSGYTIGFTLIIAATFIAYAIYTNIFTRRRMVVQREVNRLEAQSDSRLVDSLLNQDTVKYFASEDIESNRLQQVLDKWVVARLANQKALTTLHVGQSAVIALGIAAVMLLAIQYAAAGQMSVGDLVLVNAYIIQICMPLNSLGFVFRETNDAIVNVERMLDIMGAPRRTGEDEDAGHAQPLVLRSGDIVFDRVNFGYQKGHPILRDLSFHAPAGKTLAVVGGSGSGKSTLVKLLFRLYEPDEGSVQIDAQDLRDVTQRSLRDAIGIVPQDTVLFNDTIAYNIAYGRPSATRADVVRAARAAQLDAFIERLPDHYDTRVGERGVRLSGGERQRIAIARAILKDPRIIVFDEATSALDTRSERAIQTELTRLAQGRTSIIIAHRLSTVVDADHILVMERGELIEQGTHQALLDQQGVYSQMWSLQRQQGELEHTQRKLVGEPIALGPMAAEIVDYLFDASLRRQVSLTVSPADEDLQVVAHPEALRRAITLLCDNAIQQAAPNEHVEIRLGRQNNSALLSVLSTHAEPPQLASEIGEQTEATLAAFGGTLTLLPIDGHIAYTASLPLRPLSTDDTEVRERLTGRSVLVVDDEEETRDALEALLNANGAQVHLAGSAHEALTWLEHTQTREWPDVLLTDIMLGEADIDSGYALLTRITRLADARATRPMEAIAMTGFADAQDHARAQAAGFRASLTKPVPVERLITEIEAA